VNNIAFFINDMSYSGGTERMLSILAAHLSVNGFRVFVISKENCNKSFFELNDSVCFFSLNNEKYRKKSFKEMVSGVRRFCIDNNINTLISVESMTTLITIPAIYGTDIRHVCWEHFNFNVSLGRRLRTFSRYVAALLCDDVVVLTERDKSNWQSKAWCRAEMTAINNPTTFEKSDAFPVLSNKRLLSVGRLTEQKGFDFLLHAFDQIAKSPALDGWTLDIVGSGAKLDELIEIRDKLSLGDRVNFIPSTNDIRSHYASASIYVMSSRFEGFPMVLLEAMCFGLPIVSFDCDTGPREIIEHGHTGWLAKPEDVNSLSETIINAIHLLGNPGVYSDMTLKVFARAELFGVEAFVDKWVKLLSCKA
jgi:glycosyltransferase involved in cell wall biosynthesis